jgi:alcohol dehydrogenase
MSLTLDGGLDGIAHCLEVYFGSADGLEASAREVAEVGLDLIIQGLTAAKKNPRDVEARTLLGLGTDLVEEFMMPILEAAWGGEFEKIKNM